MNSEIQQALTVLREGGVIAYPTETVWGLGCDATNKDAVEKLYKIKSRSREKSMLILLDKDAKINRYVKEVPEVAWDILDAAIEPITIVYPNAVYLAENLPAKDNSIAIRITNNEFCKKLIERLKKPLVSTSANISGEKTPTTRNEISEEILSKIDYIVNLPEETTKQQPSQIIKLEVNGDFSIIRK